MQNVESSIHDFYWYERKPCYFEELNGICLEPTSIEEAMFVSELPVIDVNQPVIPKVDIDRDQLVDEFIVLRYKGNYYLANCAGYEYARYVVRLEEQAFNF